MLRILAMLLCAATFIAMPSGAQITSQSKDIVVLLPRDLPEIAQSAGQSMALHALGNGNTYLYIEQQLQDRCLR
jgi:hypothetical protein